MADTGLVDAAIIELLANDAELTALCPDGVYWDLRPAGTPAPGAFVIVSHASHSEEPGLGGITLFERTVYFVRASVAGNSRTQARQAAARIYVLLQNTMLDLTAAGYTAMRLARIDRRPYIEIDQANKTTWHHHVGQYELTSYPT